MQVIPPSYEILDHLDKVSLPERIESCGRICYKSEEKISQGSAEPFIRNIIKRGHGSVLEMAVITLKVGGDSEALVNEFLGGQPKFLHFDRPEKNELLITASVRGFREFYAQNSTKHIAGAIAATLAGKHPLFFEDLTPAGGWKQQAGLTVTELTVADVEALETEFHVKHRHIAVKFTINRAVTHELVRHRPCSFLQESQRYCRYSEDKFGNEVTFIKPMFYEEGSDEYKLWVKAMADTEKIYIKLLETSSPQAARTVLPNSCKTEIVVYTNLLEWAHIFRLRTSPAAEPSMREIMIPLQDEFQKRYPKAF